MRFMGKQSKFNFESENVVKRKKENSFYDWCNTHDAQTLLSEWDYEKNDISPNSIIKSYNNKVWWKCDKGHSWEATVVARTRKNPTGCPYCKGNLPIEGVNDFETSNPELMLDWDYSKNVGINPKNMTANSGKYVNWKCHFCGFEWISRANNRSSNKRGCPNCSMKSTSFGEQATYYYVKQIFPDAINRYHEGKFELDIFIPEIMTGIEFDGAYFHKGKDNSDREKRKYTKCQKKGIKLIRIKDASAMEDKWNSDETIGIDNLKRSESLNKIIRLLLKEIDPESIIFTRTNALQIWSTIDSKVDVEKDRSKILSDKYIREESNSFIKVKPELLQDWDYELNEKINPKAITPGCSFNLHWKCHICGFKWEARVPDRIRGDGCPCCNRNVLVEGVNDFATLYPKELLDWDYENNKIKPNQVISYNTKVAWKCHVCGFKWNTTINDKVIRKDKTGCPECGRKAIAFKRHQRAMNDGSLFKKFPQLLKFWNFEKNDGVNINDIAYGSPTRYWWLCPDCGYEWMASPNNKTRGGKVGGCPKCRYKKI